MYKQLSYIEEYDKVKKNKIVIFCSIIAAITIIIVVITGLLTYQLIMNFKANSTEVSGAKTIGVDQNNVTQTIDNTNSNEQPEERLAQAVLPEIEDTTSKNQTNNFPKHDFSIAMQSQLPQYSEEIAQKVVNVYYEKAKKVYLTFDDGPSKRTPEVLDILDRYGIKATFFVLGKNVANYPEITKRAYDSGHFIASHGYTHTYSQIYSSPQTVLDEYNQSVAAIQSAIGVPEYNPHLFRFPGGSAGGRYSSIKKEAIQLLKDNQITHTNWNCLTGDSAGNNTIEAMWNEVLSTAAGDDNLVILMHDAGDKEVTVQFLPQLIEYFQGQGYEFSNYYEIMTQ